MTDSYFDYANDIGQYYDQQNSNSNDWFGEINSQQGQFAVPDCTVEVFEVFKCVSEPPKEHKEDSIATTHSAINELCDHSHSIEPLSSQIQIGSTELDHEELHQKWQEFQQESLPQPPLSTKPQSLSELQPQYFRPPRLHSRHNILQISSHALKNKFRVGRGDRFETKNLCKHIHTETMRYLKKRTAIHQFVGDELEQVKQFCHAKASIDNFKNLFRNPEIALLCREFYETSDFIGEILRSKMQMGSKLTIVKYLDKICRLTYDPDFRAWKKEV